MQKPTSRWQCRVAPSLGALEDTPDKIWGTKPYLDQFQPTVFFGLYGLPDFYTLWRHKGPKCVLWAGSDIRHFMNGYWLDAVGEIRLEPERLAAWIDENCDNYVENGVEHEALMTYGIRSKIVPSFLADVSRYEIQYQQADRPQVYSSVSGNDFRLYGWEQIEIVADRCNVDFHLYGNSVPWVSQHPNVFVHGRVSKEEMNAEISQMQAAVRVVEFDGFSEIIAKSILWGQHPISRIGYPCVDSFNKNDELIALLNQLKDKREPNMAANKWMLGAVNKYPWNYHA